MSENNSHTETLEEIRDMLQQINLKLELHLAEDKIYKPQLLQAIQLLERSKGAVWLLTIIIAGSGLAWSVVVWAKKHINLP